jgi:hypothetical protein
MDLNALFQMFRAAGVKMLYAKAMSANDNKKTNNIMALISKRLP